MIETLQAARERMEQAKARFTVAARAALDGDPRAGSLASDALRELEEARAGLRVLESGR